MFEIIDFVGICLYFFEFFLFLCDLGERGVMIPNGVMVRASTVKSSDVESNSTLHCNKSETSESWCQFSVGFGTNGRILLFRFVFQ